MGKEQKKRRKGKKRKVEEKPGKFQKPLMLWEKDSRREEKRREKMEEDKSQADFVAKMVQRHQAAPKTLPQWQQILVWEGDRLIMYA